MAGLSVKLGIHVPLEFFSPFQAVQAASWADDAGLDHVVVNDHMRLPRGSYVGEAWTVLAAMAAETQRVRLGPSVTPLPLRHPFLLGKMAATVDQISQGRLMMGVGAGWHREEFQWLEVPFLKHKKRLEQTEEALHLLLRLWTDAKTTFDGNFYHVENVTLEPETVQKPHPPIFLGGGSLAILELTARYGKGWMPYAPSTTGLIQRLQQLEERMTANNRSIKELEIIPSILLELSKSKKAAQKQLPKWGKPPDATRAIFGSPSDCLERIQEYVEAGATHLTLRLLHPERVKQDINTIAKNIAPYL